MSEGRIWAALGVILMVLVGIVFAIGFFFSIFVYLLLAILLSYLIKPVLNRMSEHGIRRRYSLPFIVIATALVMSILVYLIIPVVVIEARGIMDEWPRVSEKINNELLSIRADGAGNTIYYSPLLDAEIESEPLQRLQDDLASILGHIISISSSVLFGLLIVPIITIILLKDGAGMKREIYKRIPNRYFEVALSIVEDINTSIGNFVYAKGVQVLVIACVSTIGYTVIGLKAAVFFGMLAGILNMIPYVGPAVTWGITSVAAYIFADMGMVLASSAVWAIAQFVDNAVVQPFIFPKLLRNHPLTVVIVTLVGAKLAGAFGMVIALPLYSIFKIVLEKTYTGLGIIYKRKEIG